MTSSLSLFPGEDDLDILTALLAESEGVGEEQDSREQADDLDGLFDDDDDEGEYKDGIEEEEERDVQTEDVASDLFGDVDDIENEDKDAQVKGSGGEACESLNKSKEDLQGELRCILFSDLLPVTMCFSSVSLLVGFNGGAFCLSSDELRRMQEQMQRLQQQLEASQKASTSSSTPAKTAGSLASPKPTTPKLNTSKTTQGKPATATQKTKTQAGKHLVAHQPRLLLAASAIF